MDSLTLTVWVIRLAFLAALYLFLALVAVFPFIAKHITGVQTLQLSSFGMLIFVGVVLDTMKQLEAQLVMRRYEGFIK